MGVRSTLSMLTPTKAHIEVSRQNGSDITAMFTQLHHHASEFCVVAQHLISEMRRGNPYDPNILMLENMIKALS